MNVYILSIPASAQKDVRSLNSDLVAGHGDARNWGPFAAVARVCDGARAVRLFGGIPAEIGRVGDVSLHGTKRARGGSAAGGPEI